jgi:hypothetical protein
MPEHAARAGVEHGVAGVVDVDAHRQTYAGFLILLKYCAIGSAIILILMAIFLT